MDLLFKRYADPFSLLNGYIRTSRLCEFLDTFIAQKVEDDRWEFFLHKVWDKTYQEFCESVQTSQDLQVMSEMDKEATVKMSLDILGSFNPDREGSEKMNGSI